MKKPFKTKEGIEGLIRVFKPYSHIRLNWKRRDWGNMTTLQIRVIRNKDKSTISFHHEKLLNSKQRDEMKEYWNKTVNEIAEKIICAGNN